MTTNTGKDVEFVSTNIGYIITTNELLETIDAGGTWLKKQNISSGNDISFYNTTGYIIGNDGYVLKSIDNGASWSQISTGFNSSFNTVNIIDDDNIILSTSNSIVRTVNGGTTWESLNVPNSNVNKTFFTNTLIGHAICNGGTILKTVDGGQNWYTIQGNNSFPSNFISVFFINENIGFASGENDYIFKTTDAGETWSQISDPGIDIYGFYFLDENNGFATGELGATYKTIDGGNSWNPIFFQSGFVQGTSIYGIYFQDSNIGFITGLNGRIMKTLDGGNNWEQYSVTGNLNKIQFLDDNIGFTNSGRNFYKTLNGGNSWAYVGSIDSFISIPKFTFVNENLGFALSDGTNGGQVFKTTNGGVTWSFLRDLFEYGGSSITFIDENIGFASGGSGSNSYNRKVMKTIDGGNNWTQVLIFTRTKHGANRLTEKLIKSGISAAAIHGNKSQGARTKALRNFKDNSIKILVATDIAARGLDIPLLPHVINYELPNVPEDYVHRIGRTGRAGAAGEAISLVCSEETEYQNEIEKLLKEKLKSTIVEGFEPTDTAPPKRAASQSKGSFGKKKKPGSSGSSQGNKPKRKPHFKGNKTAGSTSGRGRTGAPKKKRY